MSHPKGGKAPRIMCYIIRSFCDKSPHTMNCSRGDIESGSNVQMYKYANAQIRKYANTQIHKCANAQIRKYANIQMRKYANAQIRKCANMQMYKCANTQMRKYANTQMYKCANTQMRKYANMLHAVEKYQGSTLVLRRSNPSLVAPCTATRKIFAPLLLIAYVGEFFFEFVCGSVK